jgi:diaminohydroxyphosphoribosylaminopyrimidine deaminase/5-amino-6-(5-phosphoribosylamino)uracil reductase
MNRNESYMGRAVELALKGAGRTSPNPMVGAVIVKGDDIVGEGFHARAGLAHAETVALEDAGRDARGADLFVTLEPCCHKGRTPPCVDAIVAAGISRVFIGTRDPNSLVNGKGIAALRRAGIDVKTGVLRDRCREINEVYEKFMRTGLPFVTAKVALTLDGKIAAIGGDSKWITNSKCRRYVHELRSLSDAVMVGGGTVRRDDPRLTARIKGVGRGPKAIAMDEKLALPRSSKIFARRRGDLICITTKSAAPSRMRWVESKGHTVIVSRSHRGGLIDPASALRDLAKRGISSILLEGGGAMFAAFMEARLIDRLVVCVAPKLVGGDGLDFLPGMKTGSMGEAVRLADVRVKSFDDNIVIEGYPRWR